MSSTDGKRTYWIRYGDHVDWFRAIEVVGTWRCRAHDAEHALMQWDDNDDGHGWIALAIARAPTDVTRRPRWHMLHPH